MATKTVRAPMSRSKRAAQFAAFDALKGLHEAIKAKEKIPEERRFIAEDEAAEIDRVLRELEKGQVVTAVYFCEYAHEYFQLTGEVAKIDSYWNLLQIGNTAIDFKEIVGLYRS